MIHGSANPKCAKNLPEVRRSTNYLKSWNLCYFNAMYSRRVSCLPNRFAFCQRFTT